MTDSAIAPAVASSAPPSPPSSGKKARSGWRWLWLGLLALVSLVSVALTAAWVWLGQDTALTTAIEQAQRWLPAGQTLEVREARGSVRNGGQIAWLRWQGPTLAVEAREIELRWQLPKLWQRQVQVDQLHIAHVQLTATPEPDKPPPEPLEQLVLPVTIALPFQIDEIVWSNGTTPVQVKGLAGRYDYDGSKHQLDIHSLALAQGKYSAKASLQAQAPMALLVDMQGQVETALPNAPKPLLMAAQAQVQGNLASAAARLSVQASLQPVDLAPATASATDKSEKMGAEVAAQIAPWATQPLEQVQADLRALNVASLWPQAPQTALRGQIKVLPEPVSSAENPAGTGWKIEVQLHNDAAGPWNRQRLPLNQLQAQAHYDGKQWKLPQALLQVEAGKVEIEGHYTPDTKMAQGSVQIQNLRPKDLLSDLDATPLNGTVRAQSPDSAAVDFTVDVRAAAGAGAAPRQKAGSPTLSIQNLQAQGHWKAPALELQRLQVEAFQAQLQADNLSLLLGPAPVGRGNFALTVPGAQLRGSGHLGATEGKGNIQGDISAIERLLQWLPTLPGVALVQPLPDVKGQAKLALNWQGGWESLQVATAPAAPAAPAATPAKPPVRALSWDATVDIPNLVLVQPAAKAVKAAKAEAAPQRIEINALQARASGTAQQATLRLDTKAGVAPYRATLHSQIHAQREGKTAATSYWKAQLAALELQVQHRAQKGAWNVKLNQALESVFRPATSATTLAALEVAAGQATVTGPLPGTVQLHWQPLQVRLGAPGGPQLQTKGRLAGLPLAWVDALAPEQAPALAAAGVASQLILEADWDVQTHPKLRAQLQVQRTQGDIQLLHDQGAPTPAGLRQVRVRVEADGEQLQTHLLWDSAQAGQAQAQVSTRLKQQTSGWMLPEDSPLTGRVQAQMPDMGVWTVLAPPGWRIDGTLDADVALSGNLQAPQWQGRINADKLALRSLIDGVDFQEGRLRTVLRGNRLDITELHLQGGKGSQARVVGRSGNLTPPPRDGGSLDGSGNIRWGDPAHGIHLDLQAEAKALQVLVRADRQASLSGKVQAKMEQGQLVLRGKLAVDRAAILLPEASAPRLSDDVVVRRRSTAPQLTLAAAKVNTPPPTQAQTKKPIDMILILDLGRDFALEGAGIVTRLRGQLEVRSSPVPGAPPRITGEVETEQGRYRAWGQMLDIETGLLRFNGPHDNPALDILAIRPNISVRAGVQVTGAAQAPRVRLYSSPDMPDAEKLAWVITGRNSASGGAEAALLQQAALAFLDKPGGASSGSVAGKLGLDEIGFKAPSQGKGSNEASAAAISVGKRLSSKLYVTYEQGLSGAVGMVSVFYDLSRRLTLRGQSGTQSAVDIIYTVRHD